jgi:hypothetical protein
VLTHNLALVSEVPDHPAADVARVAAALQRQATRDFGPVWDVQATVDAFPQLEDVPLGYWPMIVREDIDQNNAAGIHLDKDGQPFALITMSNSWSLTASHEALEMIADPFGDRLFPGPSIKADQGRVQYLVEVCDPSESEEFAYTVNGILVSDFYTQRYFEPTKAEGARYSFSGAITEPRQVLRGGYLSWHEPVSDHWWQQTWFDSKKQFHDLGVIPKGAESFRSMIDQLTPHPVLDGLKPANRRLKQAVGAGEDAEKAAASKAATWRAEIDGLVKATAKPSGKQRRPARRSRRR